MRAQLSALALAATVLPARSSGLSVSAGLNDAALAERPRLETYIHQLTALVDQQLEELTEYLSSGEMQALRAEHYQWKLRRDLECAELGRRDPGDLAELDCLSLRTEEQFERFEVRLGELEQARSAEAP